jgi:cytochrome c oxidase assembly protein subunit 15
MSVSDPSRNRPSPAASVSSGPVRGDMGVGLWLMVIAALIALMVIVGGLTRMTESGLSITEWRPVTGALPPLSPEDWAAEFERYRGTTQYEVLNQGMGLAGFKAIYWWEWGHRFLGRVLGFVFLLPFLYFVVRKRVDSQLGVRLGVIFLLGAAQGALGWWMVQSGLADRVSVSQYRLAAHLGLAFLLFGYILWTAFEVLGVRRTAIAPLARFRPLAAVIAGLIFAQILLGAIVAGLDAGLAFSTWPSYGGWAVPPGLYDAMPWWINHFENHAMVHFQHRNIGYAIFGLTVALFVTLRRVSPDRPVRLAAVHVAVFTLAQVALGILTVVTMVALPLAALHQFFALALFGASLWLVYVLKVNQN